MQTAIEAVIPTIAIAATGKQHSEPNSEQEALAAKKEEAIMHHVILLILFTVTKALQMSRCLAVLKLNPFVQCCYERIVCTKESTGQDRIKSLRILLLGTTRTVCLQWLMLSPR